MSNQSSYGNYTIKVYENRTDYQSFGWYWEVWQGEDRIGDNSKDYGEDTEVLATFKARQHIDWMDDTEK